MTIRGVQSGPVFLSGPGLPDEPKAATGCAACRALLRQWHQATNRRNPAYDMSHAADLAVEISRHPHPRKATR